MSTYADSSKARLWLDGDAFRGTANAAAPTNPFAASISGMDAYGGIKAGFTVTPSQDVTGIDIFNNTSGADYFTSKKPPSYSVKFRAVDQSKATALTLLMGGSIAETSAGSGIWKWTFGTTEEFSLLFRVLDGTTHKKAYYFPRVTLASIPEEAMTEDDLEGFDFEIKPLAPTGGLAAIQKFTTENPLV